MTTETLKKIEDLVKSEGLTITTNFGISIYARKPKSSMDMGNYLSIIGDEITLVLSINYSTKDYGVTFPNNTQNINIAIEQIENDIKDIRTLQQFRTKLLSILNTNN